MKHIRTFVCALALLLPVLAAADYLPDYWMWEQLAGGLGEDQAEDFALDSQGNIYVAGTYQQIAHWGEISLKSPILDDSMYRRVYLAKLDNDGKWLWVRDLGGGSVYVSDMAKDAAGNLYLLLYYLDFESGTLRRDYTGGLETQIAKYDSNGDLIWNRVISGAPKTENPDRSLSSVVGYGITVDRQGSVFVTGSYEYGASFGSLIKLSEDEKDVFAAKMDQDGNWLWVWSAASNDDGTGISGLAADDAGGLCRAGNCWQAIRLGDGF